jgi:hypothetical protein
MAAKIDEIDLRIAALRRMRAELARVLGCACDSLDHCTCGAAYLARQGRERVTRLSLLHVTNGESAGNTLRRTPLGGAVLSWQDALHEGPVPAVARPELLRLRAEFLSRCGWGSAGAVLSALERRDLLYGAALRDGAQVVLWFEHDLYDQLQLLDALALAPEAERTPELILVDAFSGRTRFSGLGELSADELESLWSGRRPAADELLDEAAALWDAFRAPEPTGLTELARGPLALPFLAPALERLLEELPSTRDGLSGTERRALHSLAAGAATAAVAFREAQRLEPAPFLGDTWFYLALAKLGDGPDRLVETAEGRPLPPAPPLGDAHLFTSTPVRLTADGERVLRAERDRRAARHRPLARRHAPARDERVALGSRPARSGRSGLSGRRVVAQPPRTASSSSTTRGSKCEPALARSSAAASSFDRAFR